MSDDLTGLADDLKALVRQEAVYPSFSDTRMRRAWERLEARLSLANSLPSIPSASLGAAKAAVLTKVGMGILAAFAGGVATGWLAGTSSTPPPVASQSQSAPTTTGAAPAHEPSVRIPAVAIETLPTSNAPTASTPKATRAPGASGAGVDVETVFKERALLDQAGRTLLEGDAAQALNLLSRHEREFPRGALVEEREVLCIKALAALGHDSEARTKLDAFHKRFPASPFFPALASQIRKK